jgi:hypothetical protein
VVYAGKVTAVANENGDRLDTAAANYERIRARFEGASAKVARR